MKEILREIVKNPQTEARWLNTLSLLKHIGARKIAKTVCEGHPPVEILKHLSDETRHAYVFKNLSRIVAGGEGTGYLCTDEAVSYLQILDSTVSEWLAGATGKSDSRQNYVLVSCMIERRGSNLYQLYKKITNSPEVRVELEKIIEDEASHLEFVEDKAKKILSGAGPAGIGHCEEIEEKLFSVFASTLEKELKGAETESAQKKLRKSA